MTGSDVVSHDEHVNMLYHFHAQIYMYVLLHSQFSPEEIMLFESGVLTALLRVALCAALLLYFINVMVSGDNQLWMSS